MEQRMSLERYILTDAEESMIPSTSNDHTSEITHLACTPSSLYESFRDQNEIKNFLKEPISPAKTDSSVQPLAEWTDDYSLVEATLKAEATGTQTPLIREEIRYSIQRKRRLSGLDELRPEYKVDKDEQLTMEEEFKRFDRRERNKVAAKKCRIKKKMHAEYITKECRILQSKNTALQNEVDKLEEERQRLSEIISLHVPMCPLLHALPTD